MAENSAAWIGIVGVVIGALLGFFLTIGKDRIDKWNRKRQHRKMLIEELEELRLLYGSEHPFNGVKVGEHPLSANYVFMFCIFNGFSKIFNLKIWDNSESKFSLSIPIPQERKVK